MASGTFVKIGFNINLIYKITSEINSCTQKLGTPSDNKKLRSNLKNQREESQKLIIDTKSLLKEPFERTEKPKHDKLANEFNQILTQYEKVNKESLQKEREIVTKWEETLERKSTGAPPNEIANLLQELNMDDIDEKIIQERNRDLQNIEKELELLSECFIDMANEVEIQGNQLNTIEQHTVVTNSKILEGVKELDSASTYQKKYRIKMLILILIVLGILGLVIFLIAYFASKHS